MADQQPASSAMADQAPALPAMADQQPELPAPGEPWTPEVFAAPYEGDSPEQLSVFTAGAAQPAQPVEPPRAPYVSSQPPAPYVPPPSDDLYARGAALDEATDEPAVPGFLAGRPPRPARASRQEADFLEKVSREDLIPSWDRDGRFGAEPAERERSDRTGGIITAIAVVAILALGVAGVIFLPGLLAGGGPSRTPTPAPSAAPSDGGVLPTVSITPLASVTPSPSPEFTAAPTPTPRVYRVKRGDSLSSIARKFDVTVQEILDANPQIENPDRIQPGDELTIPSPSS
jgi:LysM repeat protein